MNITLEKNEGAVAGKLIVNIVKADYEEKLAASLKKMKQRAQMPGFRKGMVPMSLIQKMYGTEVKADELQKILADKVNKYINDEKLRVLGEPMLSDDNEAADVAGKDDFEFKFDLAFSPEINIKLDGRTIVDYYNIEVDDETVQRQIDAYRRQNGKNVDADVFSEEDLIKGTLTENGPMVEPIKIEEATLMPRFFANDKQKALFKKAKKGADIVFNPSKAYEGRANELASLLKVDKDEAEKHTSDFTFHIDSISHFELGEVDEQLIKMIYPDGSVKTVDEFKAKVKADVEAQYQQDSDYKFMLDLKSVVMKKVGKVELAEDLLKKMVLQNAKTEEGKKQIEENIGSYLDDLRWSLVKNELTKSLDIKVDDAQLMAASKRLIKMQMAQYGILNFPDEQLEQFATERLKDEKQRENIINNAIDTALTDAAKKAVKLKEKAISIADFNKMFE
ncbi:MAG: trigger factor [Bacteroidaceae bacterium]|nr:trigger factor [Bacteroidaceae bacterium]